MIDQKNKPSWKDWTICVVIGILMASLCNLAAYIPTIRSLPEPDRTDFLRDRAVWAPTVGTLYYFMWFCCALIALKALNYIKNLKIKSLLLAFVPHTCYALFTLNQLYYTRSIAESNKKSVTDLLFGDIKSKFDALYPKVDLEYYFAAVLIGYLVLILYSGYRKRLLKIVQAVYTRMEEPPKAMHYEDKDLLAEAQRLANTYVPPIESGPSEEDIEEIDIDFYAFVYGEGFDYVVVNEGHVVPFLSEDEEGIDDAFDGVFLHINKSLYVRYDHIIALNLKELYIIVSPELTDIFRKITKESVKNKLMSYRYKGKPNRYRIDSSLVGKLKRKLDPK